MSWAFDPGPSTPVMTNWASAYIAPSIPMNGIVPPSPIVRAGSPKATVDTTTVDTIEEDSPQSDCRVDGNRVCGEGNSQGVPAGDYGQIGNDR